jgi:hypothetical protein
MDELDDVRCHMQLGTLRRAVAEAEA